MKQKLLKPLIIYGCGGHARSVADVAISIGITNIIFIDSNARPNEKILDHSVLTSYQPELKSYCIVALGDNQLRQQLFAQLVATDQAIVSIVAADAYVGKDTHIHQGVFIGHGAYAGPQTAIGENTIINTHSVIEHNCSIGKHCHISINATVAGTCQIGDFVMIGAGATVLDNVSICSQVTIGAGAVVVENITSAGTYVGVPARKLSP